jgi:mono/diheme cytochrome c family protein
MRLSRLRLAAHSYGLGVASCIVFTCALVGALSLTTHARQLRTAADGVYSAEQATRGQQVYVAECASCHGPALEGVVGPPLAGAGFGSAWSGRSLTELVDKIEKTMPLQAPGSLSRAQAIDVTAHMLAAGKFPAGRAGLSAATLAAVAMPVVRTATAPVAAGGPAFAPTGNLAQVMRGITFPNANILFNVQVKEPATRKPPAPVPFDYVTWGATAYYGWQAVDQAALALIESTPLFMLSGRRCENGQPVPIDRDDWKKLTADLVEAGRASYRASQSRNVDAVIKVADQLNASCENCHKVYRDVAAEGQSAGSARCR